MKILRGCSYYTYTVERAEWRKLLWQSVCALIRGQILVRVELTKANMPTYPDYAELEQIP